MTENARKFAADLIESSRVGQANVDSFLWDGRTIYDVLATPHDQHNLYFRKRGSVRLVYKPRTLEGIEKSPTTITNAEKNAI